MHTYVSFCVSTCVSMPVYAASCSWCVFILLMCIYMDRENHSVWFVNTLSYQQITVYISVFVSDRVKLEGCRCNIISII